MNLHLEGKVAIVTGATAGIGEAVAFLFSEEGASVVVHGRDAKRGAAVTAKCGRAQGKAVFIAGDLTSELACQHLVQQTLQTFGRIDVLVNNAGVNDGIGLEQSPAEFMASLQKNLFHVFAVTHFAREALIASRGTIVNLGSKVADTGQGHTSGYAAAKGGINALTREWALSLAPEGVRVNCVVPAECDSLQYRTWFANQPDSEAARKAIEALVPLGHRLTTSEEIAAMVVFLASSRSAHTTGQIIHVDGGYTHLDRAASHEHGKWALNAGSEPGAP